MLVKKFNFKNIFLFKIKYIQQNKIIYTFLLNFSFYKICNKQKSLCFQLNFFSILISVADRYDLSIFISIICIDTKKFNDMRLSIKTLIDILYRYIDDIIDN